MRWPSPQLLAAQGPQGRCRNEGVEDTPHLIFCRPQGDHRKPVWVRGLRPPGIALTPESQCPADPRAGAVLPSSRSGLCTQISERRSQMCRCPSNSGSSAYRLFILEGCTAARGFRTELPTLRLFFLWAFFPVVKSTGLFVSKSTLFCVSRALAKPKKPVGLVPSSSLGPELCQEGTQVSGGDHQAPATTKAPCGLQATPSKAGISALQQAGPTLDLLSTPRH